MEIPSGILEISENWINGVGNEYRKKNIAEQLLNEVEKCFSSIGITYIECHYTAKNKLAQQFWDKNQYTQSSIMARKLLK